jgi:hypothetical protein
MKPHDYRARRQWQIDARARGEVPECGREACHEPADPAWVGSGTGVELLYCAGCARLINRYTPGTCRPEVLVKPDLTIANDAQTPKRLRPSGAFLASLLAIGAGADPFPGMPEPRPSAPNPDRGRHAKKTERRRERKAANAKRTP